MDPDACYFTIYESMRDGDLATARGHALALKEWLDKGGFYPQHYSHQEVTAYLADVLRRTVPYRRGQRMTNRYQAAKRRYPALHQRFGDEGQFLGYSLHPRLPLQHTDFTRPPADCLIRPKVLALI